MATALASSTVPLVLNKASRLTVYIDDFQIKRQILPCIFMIEIEGDNTILDRHDPCAMALAIDVQCYVVSDGKLLHIGKVCSRNVLDKPRVTFSVCLTRGNHNGSLLESTHVGHGFLQPREYRSGSDHEHEWIALMSFRAVEYRAVSQSTFIKDADPPSDFNHSGLSFPMLFNAGHGRIEAVRMFFH